MEESNAAIKQGGTANAAQGDDSEARSKEKDSGATIKDTIDFEPHRNIIDQFKNVYIYSAMRAEEAQHHMWGLVNVQG